MVGMKPFTFRKLLCCTAKMLHDEASPMKTRINPDAKAPRQKPAQTVFKRYVKSGFSRVEIAKWLAQSALDKRGISDNAHNRQWVRVFIFPNS
jgi:hypothetical protein